MKKKITAIAVIAALVAVAIIGGTLAYVSDTDSANNTFTMGNVQIELEETFDKDNADLLPGSQNSVQKEVDIKNTGDEDAYVWYEWLIPSVLDSTDGSTGTNNFVHVNSFGYTWDTYRENSKYWPEGQTEALPLEQTWDHTKYGTEGYIGQEEVGGVMYNKYVVLYHGILEPDDATTPAMSKVYLDMHVDYDEEEDVYFWSDRGVDPKTIPAEMIESFDIIVRAYGIQAKGFADVYEAYQAYLAQVG